MSVSRKLSNFFNSSYFIFLLASKKYFFIENNLNSNILNIQKKNNLKISKYIFKKSTFLSIFENFKKKTSIKFPLNLYLLENETSFKCFFNNVSNLSTLVIFLHKKNLFQDLILSKTYFETFQNYFKLNILCSYNIKFLVLRTFYR